MSYNPVNPNGQTTKANSAPVTIASDQNIALETGGNLASIVTNTNSLNNTVGTLSAGTAATKSLAVGGVYNSSTPTPTTGQQLSLQLDGSGNLKISGTVTANLGTIDGAALATNQTDGSQKTKIVDGSGNVIGATSNALDVNIKSGGSGGTQYTNNAVQATPTGTVALGYDGTNVRGLLTDGTGKLQTNITNTSLAVTGTFYQATQPVSLASNNPTLQSGSTTAVTQATGTNLHTVIDSGTVTANISGNIGNTVFASTQSGTWNINNISGTVSLPTGAATLAKQPALGTAGTPSVDVLTVQGASLMTALKVDGSATTQPVSGTITANLGTIDGAALA
ncbi:MAG: hypothetical protein WCI37_03170, partial [bacterium]